jgi:hypothetical protein
VRDSGDPTSEFYDELRFRSQAVSFDDARSGPETLTYEESQELNRACEAWLQKRGIGTRKFGGLNYGKKLGG